MIESIRHDMAINNTYGVGSTQFNLANLYRKGGNLEEAAEFAHASLKSYLDHGNMQSNDIEKAKTLIALIENERKARQETVVDA